MAKERPSVFTRYDFSGEEEYAARVFSDLQEKHLRNELAIASEKRVLLEYDPTEHARYVSEVKYLEGFIAAIMMLLGMSMMKAEEYAEVVQEVDRQQSFNDFDNGED